MKIFLDIRHYSAIDICKSGQLCVCVYVWVCYFVCAPSQVESISLLLSRVALDHTNKNKAATTTKIEEQL